MSKPILTQARLKELLDYCPETGLFTWKKVTTNRVKVGYVAGHPNKIGYVEIRIDGTLYLGHRLVFLCMTGSWPEMHVDHINRHKNDNRWKNLRAASPRENNQNKSSPRRGNKSGLLGVSATNQKSGVRFRSTIQVDGKQTHIGTFDTPEEAHLAYVETKRRIHTFNTL